MFNCWWAWLIKDPASDYDPPILVMFELMDATDAKAFSSPSLM